MIFTEIIAQIDKLISERGSSSILRDLIALLKERALDAEAQIQELQQQIAALKAAKKKIKIKCRDLETKNRTLETLTEEQARTIHKLRQLHNGPPGHQTVYKPY